MAEADYPVDGSEEQPRLTPEEDLQAALAAAGGGAGPPSSAEL